MLFKWYWLADFCADHDIPFVLGHALDMKAVHGAKSGNDRLDAERIARLLHGGLFPVAYVYPRGMRSTRDLMRRRSYLVHQRSGLMHHIQITNTQYNLSALGKIDSCSPFPPRQPSRPEAALPAGGSFFDLPPPLNAEVEPVEVFGAGSHKLA